MEKILNVKLHFLCSVNNPSFEPSIVLLSFEYQLAHLALKSLIKIVIKGLKMLQFLNWIVHCPNMCLNLFGFDSEIYIAKLICKSSFL